MKSCGTCEHWSKNTSLCGGFTVAICEIEFNKIPALDKNFRYFCYATRNNQGSECPLWKAKNDN